MWHRSRPLEQYTVPPILCEVFEIGLAAALVDVGKRAGLVEQVVLEGFCHNSLFGACGNFADADGLTDEIAVGQCEV